MKGNVPANKGKKWDEFLSKRKQKRCAKGWKNLDLYRPKGRPDFGALRQKRVIAINDEGRWVVPVSFYTGFRHGIMMPDDDQEIAKVLVYM